MVKKLLAAWVVVVAAASIPVVPQSPQARASLPAHPVKMVDAVARNGSWAPYAPVSLVLSGRVSGLASAGEPFSATVHFEGRTTRADVLGDRFSVSILAAPDAMVRIEVASTRVHYVSIAGTAAQLKRRSGGDGQVTFLEQHALHVSPTTTAVAFMTRRVLGQDPVSDAEAERVSQAFGSYQNFGEPLISDVSTMASVLARIASGHILLPAGFSTGYQLVSDEAAYRSVLEQAGVKVAAAEYPFRSTDHRPLANLGELPGKLFLTAQVNVSDVPTGGENVKLLNRTSAGLYQVFTSPGGVRSLGKEAAVRPQPEYSASLTAEGELRLVPLQSAVVETFAREDGARTLRTIQARTFRQLTQGDRFSLWASRTEWTESYPDAPERPVTAKSAVELWTGGDLSRIIDPKAWQYIPSRLALPRFCMVRTTSPEMPDGSVLKNCDYVQHQFLAGAAGKMLDVGQKVDAYMQPKAGDSGLFFSWTTLDNSSQLQISTADTHAFFWVIDSPSSAVRVIFYLVENRSGFPLGQTLVGRSLVLQGDYEPFGPSQATGTWKLQGWMPALPYPSDGAQAYITRNVDHRGLDFTGYNGMADPGYPSTWELFDGRAYDTRYLARFSSDTRYVYDCQEATASGASDCSPFRVRYFRPLLRTGQRVYGILDYYYQTQLHRPSFVGPYQVYWHGAMPTYYDCVNGSCSAYGTAGAPQAFAP